jgi:hypothetical protein
VLITAMNTFGWRQRQAPEFPDLGGSRRWLALLALVMLILTFAPVPFHGADVGWKGEKQASSSQYRWSDGRPARPPLL